MNNSITVIGDVHGKYEHYHKIIHRNEKNPFTVCVGDFGFKYDTLKNVDHTKHIIIPGNHDNYYMCYRYPHFLYDYGYIELNKISFFYYRGAYSIDKQYRTIGIDWWSEEQVSIDQFMKARVAYRELKPEIVITHDCPEQIASLMIEPHQRIYQNTTSWALGELFNIHQPRLWLFGHWHQSRTIQYGDTKFICLNELETYQLVA